MNNIAIFKLEFDCARQGSLKGVFTADKTEVKYLVDNAISVHFGEVLGKHSDIRGPVTESEVTMVTDDPKVVQIFREYGLSTGFNPLAQFPYGVDDAYNDEGEQLTIGEYIEKQLKKTT